MAEWYLDRFERGHDEFRAFHASIVAASTYRSLVDSVDRDQTLEILRHRRSEKEEAGEACLASRTEHHVMHLVLFASSYLSRITQQDMHISNCISRFCNTSHRDRIRYQTSGATTTNFSPLLHMYVICSFRS